jgi:hypothetical protein
MILLKISRSYSESFGAVACIWPVTGEDDARFMPSGKPSRSNADKCSRPPMLRTVAIRALEISVRHREHAVLCGSRLSRVWRTLLPTRRLSDWQRVLLACRYLACVRRRGGGLLAIRHRVRQPGCRPTGFVRVPRRDVLLAVSDPRMNIFPREHRGHRLVGRKAPDRESRRTMNPLLSKAARRTGRAILWSSSAISCLANCSGPSACLGVHVGDRIAITIEDTLGADSNDAGPANVCGFGFDVSQGQVLQATIVSTTVDAGGLCAVPHAQIASFGAWTWTFISGDGGGGDTVLSGDYAVSSGGCTGTTSLDVRVVGSASPFAPFVQGVPPSVIMDREFGGGAGCRPGCTGSFIVSLQRL